MSSFPPVEFNTTLCELFLEDAPKGASGKDHLETICNLKPNSDPKYGNSVPFSNKYIIHSAQTSDSDTLAHLQLEICSYLLMFFAGNMKVAFLAAEGSSNDKTLTKEAVDEKAKDNFSVIQESQRPIISTYANIEDFITNHDSTPIRWAFAMDFAEDLPYLFHPTTIYEINSKRWLARNPNLDDVNDDVIECVIQCGDHNTAIPKNESAWYYGGSSCVTCNTGITDEVSRIIAKIKQRPIPFVLKLTQSLASVGTHIVKDEKKRREVLSMIDSYLRDYLPRITRDNAFLHTTSLVVSDALDGETYALNYFINRDGSPVFLGACHQLATGETGRQSTAIVYADQEKLEKKYQKTAETVGKMLHEEKYYGPVGVDIMEDENGKQYVIDANVRVPLSMLLYPLRTHFNEKRGYREALVYECVFLNKSRQEFEERFQKEMEEAKIIIIGSTRIGEKKEWAYGIIMAGKSRDEIFELSDRILEDEVDKNVDDVS